MIPNSRNFCGGNFQDWLEVNLIETCNARCSWCIERDGYHPKHHASTEEMASAAIGTGKTNIILLGGEPLLYRNIQKLITILTEQGRRVWITTNGILLSRDYVSKNLVGVFGVNISIHHYVLQRNKNITGVLIDEFRLIEAIYALRSLGATIRMNCNSILGEIDAPEKISQYVNWAKYIGASKVRFAELKQDDDGFVDLAKALDYKYGLNDNPFLDGCNSDCVIHGIPVNFRQMCGLQTSRRIKPVDPIQKAKQVLYYDGKIYDGWQTSKREEEMSELGDLIKKVTGGKLSDEEIDGLIIIMTSIAKYEADKVRRDIPIIQPQGCCY